MKLIEQKGSRKTMRKLTALFTACLMAAAMMVPAFAADVEEVPEIVIEIDGENGIMPHDGYNCTCGGSLEVERGPYYDMEWGAKLPHQMCSHHNPQHMVVERTRLTTYRYRCNMCDTPLNITTRQKLNPDCMYA